MIAKIKTTDAEIKGTPLKWRLKTNYCSMQSLLGFHSPIAYTYSKMWGWKADYYILSYKGQEYLLGTGYAPVDGRYCKDCAALAKLEALAMGETKEGCEALLQQALSLFIDDRINN